MKRLNILTLLMSLGLVPLYIAAARAAGDDRLFWSSAFCMVLGIVLGVVYFHKELIVSRPLNWLAMIIWPPGRWVVVALALAWFGVGVFQFVSWMFNEPRA
jgi:hypothetical protein